MQMGMGMRPPGPPGMGMVRPNMPQQGQGGGSLSMGMAGGMGGEMNSGCVRGDRSRWLWRDDFLTSLRELRRCSVVKLRVYLYAQRAALFT